MDQLSAKLKDVENHLENDVKVVKVNQDHLQSETKNVLEEQKTKMTKVEDMAHELELKVSLVRNQSCRWLTDLGSRASEKSVAI